ncbi:acyl-CoA synthetase (AMP-forming)/AMP-acid ligase II [Crossiella equi]|uniref:Acyl-CoA synthetase (AMP-forming)/AMP-acid ligase II n=1 Tax=Crossiella equi TaxID=130796 RepID=A0ABS5ANV3_9PSEU|nr:FadD3 family acyl-CoA ligase [Crossiella equi]MBP2478101.1 acyl-CoA synthetase (AMP-forming)/AMP-acid ligase II [Crossiella equi]
MFPGTVPEAVELAAERFGEAEAVVDNGVRWSFTELAQRVRVAAGVFRRHGVRAGDTVAVCAPNTPHWLVSALGALHAGGVLVPVGTRLTAPETLDVLHRAKVRVLVMTEPFLGLDRLAALRAAGLPEDVVVLPLPVAPTANSPFSEGPPVYPGERVEVSDILFTSGTTGRAKGVMSAHRQSLGVAAAWVQRCGLRADDRYLAVNPFSHSFGYKAGILACLLSGAALVPQAVFSVAETARLVGAERISVLPGAPTLYQSMLDAGPADGLGTLRLAVTGGALVPVRLVERMRAELGFDLVLTAYGLTEAVVATMSCPEDDPVTVASTCGRVAAGFELRVAGDGEVLLRGPNTMLGYLDDPRATAAAIDADGWLHTGDVGRVDGRGYLAITDRLKDMYTCGGFNVYPAEVERVLSGLPGVGEVAVVGVPDHRMGEVGRAFVVPTPGRAPSTEDIIGHCRDRLAGYKVPRTVQFRESLPRNASGKVLKQQLREEG